MTTISGLTNSYSILRGKKTMPAIHPRNYRKEQRLHYIQKMQSHIPKHCPECGEPLTTDEEQVYCPVCGLVTQDSYTYQAGQHFILPHGLKLM